VEEPVTDEFGNPVLGDDGEPLTQFVERPQGVYLNVELPDKHFLRHRGLWSEGSTWLYKQDDIGLPELKEPKIASPTPEQSSPAYRALAYLPFAEAQYSGYFPWDLDASIRTTTGGIYSAQAGGRKNQLNQHPYQEIILNHPVYRQQYNAVLLALLDGPMSVGAVHTASPGI